MNSISIQVDYDAFPADFVLEDFAAIEDFKKELSENYVANLKGTPVGRGGIAYELIVNSILNCSLEDFINWIIGGLAYDTVKHGTKSLLLKPFFTAFEKLNSQNNNAIAIREFRLKFEIRISEFPKDTVDLSVFQIPNLKKIDFRRMFCSLFTRLSPSNEKFIRAHFRVGTD